MPMRALFAGLALLAFLGGALVVLGQERKTEVTPLGPPHHSEFWDAPAGSCRAHFDEALARIATAVDEAKESESPAAKADAALGAVDRLVALLGESRSCAKSGMEMNDSHGGAMRAGAEATGCPETHEIGPSGRSGCGTGE